MDIIIELQKVGVRFEKGLTKREFIEIEERFNISFPQDLKEFLSAALPVSNNFVNWRSVTNYNKIKSSLNWPLEGMIFDIENNDFWFDGWGKRPQTIDEAINKCKKEFSNVPKLIPICSHRYIPSEPLDTGNPILSVYQTDIIYYGEDLTSYLKVEFGLKKYSDIQFDKMKKIRFWSELIEEYN